jgi:hypothetical protein
MHRTLTVACTGKEPGQPRSGTVYKVIHIAEDGTEEASVELDDFTVEVVYSGIAKMLAQAESERTPPVITADLPTAAKRRRERILTQIRA